MLVWHEQRRIHFRLPGENWSSADLVRSDLALLRDFIPPLIQFGPVGNHILAIDSTGRTIIGEISDHDNHSISLTAFPDQDPLAHARFSPNGFLIWCNRMLA